MQIKEFITSSWYEYSKGDAAGLHPYEGETKAKYTGPTHAVDVPPGLHEVHLDEGAPYDGKAMEVGPARPHAGGLSPAATRTSARW